MTSAILQYCLHLKNSEAFDENSGCYYLPFVGKPTFPEHPCETGICTNTAVLFAKRFKGKVCGYPIDTCNDNDISLVGRNSGGHDFCVIGNLIVDWWAWHVEESIKFPIIDVWIGVRKGLYDNPSKWTTWPQFNYSL